MNEWFAAIFDAEGQDLIYKIAAAHEQGLIHDLESLERAELARAIELADVPSRAELSELTQSIQRFEERAGCSLQDFIGRASGVGDSFKRYYVLVTEANPPLSERGWVLLPMMPLGILDELSAALKMPRRMSMQSS